MLIISSILIIEQISFIINAFEMIRMFSDPFLFFNKYTNTAIGIIKFITYDNMILIYDTSTVVFIIILLFVLPM